MKTVSHLPSPRAGNCVHMSAHPTPAQTKQGRMLHLRTAAPTWNTAIDPSARQAAIENALSMALYFVRQPGDVAANRWAATARANRALTLLKQASEGMAPASPANALGRV